VRYRIQGRRRSVGVNRVRQEYAASNQGSLWGVVMALGEDKSTKAAQKRDRPCTHRSMMIVWGRERSIANILYTRVPKTPAEGAVYVPWRRLLSVRKMMRKTVMMREDINDGTRTNDCGSVFVAQ